MKTSNRLGSGERLKKKKYFEAVFQSGQAIHKPGISLYFLALPTLPRSPVQVAFTVPKRLFKHATQRNRLKRRMRETYRLNKGTTYNALLSRGQGYGMVFVYTHKTEEPYTVIDPKIIVLLQTFIHQITGIHHENKNS